MLNKQYLNGLLNNLSKEESLKEEPLTKNSKVLLVDSMNTFIRCFAMINHINPNGNHIGGLTGFIKSIGYAIKMIKPTKVILVFDGLGSTQNKKLLYPQYKGNRNITRITNWEIFSNKDEEVESMANQMSRLVEYLKQLPVQMLSIEKIEADDVIGFLSSYYKQFDSEVVIMSADQDFLQLVDNKTSVYSPVKKKFYGEKEILEEYNIPSKNFLTYKILLGDKADNLPGIDKMGPKKIIKLFPDITKYKFTLDEVFKQSILNTDKHVLYQKVNVCQNQLLINHQLMDITNPNIHPNTKQDITNIIEQSEVPYNKMKFITMWNNDKLGDAINVNTYLDFTFKYLKAF